MADFKAELVQNFSSITNADPATAESFLEAHGWDMEVALSNYFEDGGKPTATASTPAGDSPSQAAPTASASNQQQPPASAAGRSSRIATLGSAANASQPSAGAQSFYTGGAKSGMLVQGRPEEGKQGTGAASLIENILKQAAKGGRRGGVGGEEDSEKDGEDEQERKKGPPVFQGAGYTLGASAGVSASSSGTLAAAAASGSSAADAGDAAEAVSRTLTFWRDGFSIEDGPLMRYDDPQSQAILESINRGQAPLSLFNVQRGQRADVKVAHRMQVDFVPPKPKPFSGSGHRLGSVVPGDIQPAVKAASSNSAAAQAAINQPQVDPSKPHTSLQLRLQDGSRLVAQLNMTHTIGDLRAFIDSNSAQRSSAYQLQTQFPTRTLDDNSKTLADYGLQNAVIFQKAA